MMHQTNGFRGTCTWLIISSFICQAVSIGTEHFAGKLLNCLWPRCLFSNFSALASLVDVIFEDVKINNKYSRRCKDALELHCD